MKRKIIAISILFCITIAICIWNRPLYGNDIESIEKIIMKSDIITRPIDIIGMEDIANYCIVGSMEDGGRLGVALFIQNKYGNYERKRTEIHENNFTSILGSFRGIENLMGVEIVIINSPEVAKVELIIDDEVTQEKQVLNYPSMMLLPIKETNKAISVDIKYYNYKGEDLRER